MKIDDLLDKPLREVLEEYCVVFSPECDYYYGITKWEDANSIYEEFDLEEEYCFNGDYLIPLSYGFEEGENILSLKDLKQIMAKLGVAKKQSCPLCGSDNYHFDYNKMDMLCNECGYEGEAEYEKLTKECE
ncbi:MAG: hypothetical protein J6A15_01030 [Clostridia bacterium]|nr:hypothetical protein [Clostridia bacterium]